MSAEISMTDEVKTVAEKISSWVQILITELHSIKSHTEENMQNMKTYKSSLHLCDELRQPHTDYISKYSYFNISCCNIIFSRMSQLYKQFHLKAAHCSNENELTLKWRLSDSLMFEEKMSWVELILRSYDLVAY
jgi:hypothetical protein